MIRTEEAVREMQEVRSLLLRSAKADRPPPRALRSTLVALGVATVTGTGTTAAAAQVLTRVALWKWLGVGVVTGVSTLGVVSVVETTDVEPAPVASTRSVRHVPTSASDSPAPAFVALEPPPATPSASSVPSAPPSSTPVPHAVHQGAAREESRPTETVIPPARLETSRGTRSDLAEELAVVDAAQRALNEGDGWQALRDLDQHQARFERPQLGDEVVVLRIEALRAVGRCSEASDLAVRFVRTVPASAAAQRVTTLLRAPCTGPSPR